jgi:PAS domain S-box-containing protein
VRKHERLDFQFLDATLSSVLFIDKQLRVVFANRNYLIKTRQNNSDVTGQSLTEVFPGIILENFSIVSEIREVLRTNLPFKGRYLKYRVPGVPLTSYCYSIVPYADFGIVKGVILVMDDVSEQLRMIAKVNGLERHLASIVRYASDMVISLDLEYNILTWNPAASQIFGYSSEEVIGNNFINLLAESFVFDSHRMNSIFMECEGSPHINQMDMKKKDGELIVVSWVCSPMLNDQGNLIGIVAIGRDLSKYQQMQMDLARSQKLAALGVMAGGIAHEIRNPLGVASSAAQFIMDKNVTDEFRKECAEKIFSGIQRASDIIENLLKYARPVVNDDLQSIVLSTLLHELLLLVSNQAVINKVRILTEIDNSSFEFIGKRDLIQQLFMNLFLNAIEAMPDGGTLHVSMKESPENVSVNVTDTGVGIAEQDIGKIFDPFFTTMSTKNNTGLGLSLAYFIVQHHGGVIEVSSEKFNGTTFRVKFPVEGKITEPRENT